MSFLSYCTVASVFLLAAIHFVDAKKLQVDKGSNIASMIKSELLLTKKPSGWDWNFQNLQFAIKDLVVPGEGSGTIDLDLRPASSFGERSTYSLGDGSSIHPIMLSKQVLVSTDPDEIFSAVSVDLGTQDTFGFFQSNGKKNPGVPDGKVFKISQKKVEL